MGPRKGEWLLWVSIANSQQSFPALYPSIYFSGALTLTFHNPHAFGNDKAIDLFPDATIRAFTAAAEVIAYGTAVKLK